MRDATATSETPKNQKQQQTAQLTIPSICHVSLSDYLRKERSHQTRVLSIQSHVVSGYVGNKCAVFPLQLHGFEVDFVNSVHFSNHTQYEEGTRGQRLCAADLEQVFEGLCVNNLERDYSHILTGYCGEATFLQKIAAIVKHCRQHRPDLLYVCDPVLGDKGNYYVPRELCSIYREVLLPLADIITPNAFELSELSGGLPVGTEAECLRAIRQLHSSAPNLRCVVCTSLNGLSSAGAASSDFPNKLFCYASERQQKKNEIDPLHFYRFEVPHIDEHFTGTGDLFSALLIIWWEESGGNLCAAVSATLSCMQAVLKRTAEEAAATGAKSSAAVRELRLVNSRLDLLRPKLDEVKFSPITLLI